MGTMLQLLKSCINWLVNQGMWLWIQSYSSDIVCWLLGINCMILFFRTLIHLKQRVDYLAHAIMCMRSDKVGAAPNLGVFLRELEDQMEVARIQQKVFKASCSFAQYATTRSAMFQFFAFRFWMPFQICVLNILNQKLLRLPLLDWTVIYMIWLRYFKTLILRKLKFCTGYVLILFSFPFNNYRYQYFSVVSRLCRTIWSMGV